MLETVKKMLTAGIDGQKLVDEIADHFYQTILDNRKDHSILYDRLTEYETLQQYFDMDQEGLDYEEKLLLDDLQADIEYALQYQFDLVEDSVKRELLHGSSAKTVTKEMKEKKIIPINPEDPLHLLNEDSVEEFYIEAFRQFDMLRMNLYTKIVECSPKGFYDQGAEREKAFRKKHGLLMDERDFIDCYLESFDKERLEQLLDKKIYETIHYNSRYRLEELEEGEDLTEDDSEQEPDENGDGFDEEKEPDTMLVPIGDMRPEQFPYVYNLMNEYTGRRVLPAEDERVTEAYWSIYGDDFGDLLGLFMIDVLEKTIRYLDQEKPVLYETLAKFYHWNQEQRKDPQVILESSDKIATYLAELQEKIWNDFAESELMPRYETGKKIATGK